MSGDFVVFTCSITAVFIYVAMIITLLLKNKIMFKNVREQCGYCQNIERVWTDIWEVLYVFTFISSAPYRCKNCDKKIDMSGWDY